MIAHWPLTTLHYLDRPAEPQAELDEVAGGHRTIAIEVEANVLPPRARRNWMKSLAATVPSPLKSPKRRWNGDNTSPVARPPVI